MLSGVWLAPSSSYAYRRVHDPGFTFSGAQAEAARRAIVDAQVQHEDKIVTKVEPIDPFHKAEGYHQQYAERTGHHGCPVGKLSDI